jgi:hypothetical protein
MVGDLEDLNTNLCAFIRLENACDIGMITEVDLPTRSGGILRLNFLLTCNVK